MLMKLKSAALEAVRTAAESGDVNRIVVATDRLRAIEDLLRRQEALDQEVAQLDVPITRQSDRERAVASAERSPSPTSARRIGESPRAIGDRRRAELVKRLVAEGRKLTPYRGALYKNARGQVIGIAYASERKKDGWFLGLQTGSFDHAILLCEWTDGRTFSVCLPKSFFEAQGRQLSKSQGQTKFNVNRRGSHFVMPIPAVGPVVADEFINRFDLVA